MKPDVTVVKSISSLSSRKETKVNYRRMPETKSNYGRVDGDKGGCEEKGTVGDGGDEDDEESV